jgi:hypothetical protein
MKEQRAALYARVSTVMAQDPEMQLVELRMRSGAAGRSPASTSIAHPERRSGGLRLIE